MRRAAAACAARLLLAAALLAPGVAPAQAPAGPGDAPVAEDPLRDPDFGVRTRGLGLQRKVEMYQWRRAGNGAYVRVWSEQPIASAGHDARHANPDRFPIRSRYWIAARVALDGRPVQEDVLKEFGRWRVFRPGFTALPGNLAATFQPEGDGLSSSENPLDPQIGDLRITWHELVLPPLAGRVVLEDGVWVPSPGAAQDDLAARGAAADARDDAGPVGARGRMPGGWRMLALGACLVLVVLLLALARRRR